MVLLADFQFLLSATLRFSCLCFRLFGAGIYPRSTWGKVGDILVAKILLVGIRQPGEETAIGGIGEVTGGRGSRDGRSGSGCCDYDVEV